MVDNGDEFHLLGYEWEKYGMLTLMCVSTVEKTTEHFQENLGN